MQKVEGRITRTYTYRYTGAILYVIYLAMKNKTSDLVVQVLFWLILLVIPQYREHTVVIHSKAAAY